MTILVSAILPTRGRRQWAEQALQCFLAQTYPAKNLWIVDDADDPSFYFATAYHNVSHQNVNNRLSIAEKRNIAAAAANGDVICHFDSDDYSSPTRIADQVKLLEESEKAVTGFHSMLFYDDIHKRLLKFCGHNSYALGTSLMYRKTFWELHNFQNGKPNPNIGEDNGFVKASRDSNELISVDAGNLMVARIHAHNTSVKDPYQGLEYHPVSMDNLPSGFSCAPADFPT